MWKCPKCRERLDDGFDVCWNCGTSPMWQVCAKRKLANVTLGMGHPGSGAHAPNENIRLDNYWRALRATVELFGRYATQQ